MKAGPILRSEGVLCESSQEDSIIRSTLIHQLYLQGSSAFMGAFIAVVLLTISLWNQVPRLHVILWLLVYTVVHVVRQISLRSYGKFGADHSDTKKWETKFAIGNYAAGSLWGLAAIALFPENSAYHQYLLALVIFGISCGGAVLYWASTACYFPTILVELLPLSGRFFYKGDETGVMTGIAILIFCVVVLRVARYLNSFGVESLRLRFEKESLVQSLEEYRDELETKVKNRTKELSSLNEALCSEIYERSRVEESLRTSEEKYRLVVDNAGESIVVSQDGVLVFVNPKTTELSQYPESELLSKPFTEFIHPDDRELVRQNHEKRLRGDEFSGHYAFRIVNKSGAVRWVENSSVRIQWDGRPAALAFMTDVTERKSIEKALRESEEKYRRLIETTDTGYLILDSQGKVVDANMEYVRLSGHTTLDEITDRGVVEWTAEHDRDRNAAEVTKCLQQGFVRGLEIDYVDEEGRISPVEINASVVNTRESFQIVALCRDISERKLAEKTLEESERKYRTLFEDSADALFMVMVDGTLIDANNAFFHLFGYEREEILGQTVLKVYENPADRSSYYEALLANGFVRDYPLTFVRKDGRHIDCLISSRVEVDKDGKVLTSRGFIRDITEQKNLQRQLLQSQKMEAVGTLAGGIAHDFNNLLQVTQGYSELLLEEKTPENPDYSDLQKILHTAKSGAELVQRLLMFSRKTESKPAPINLNKQIAQVEKLLRRAIPKMVDIHLDLSPDLPEICADPSQVEQALMNLALNARDAMPDGGNLTVSTQTVTLDEEQSRLHIEADPGDYVLLQISDTGVGMDKHTIEHIFEPFFTTKEVGRGTGLGLSMVYGIVKQNSGHITVFSRSRQRNSLQGLFPRNRWQNGNGSGDGNCNARVWNRNRAAGR